MKPKKIFISGNFGYKTNHFDGQTVKTIAIHDELALKFGLENINFVDTSYFQSNPISTIIKLILGILKSKNIVLMPDKRAFIFFYYILNILPMNRKNFYYVAIGGWVPSFVSGKKRYINFLEKFIGIYVETEGMLTDLTHLGLDNVVLMPNFRRFSFPKKDNQLLTGPIKLVVFSRILKEKGIELAIDAVNQINKSGDNILVILDIYGPIQSNYEEQFELLRSKFNNYINYKGILSQDEIYDNLSNYDVLLFPTFFASEGFPGTIIDAYISGLPVIASDWAYNTEFIQHGFNGLLFKSEDLIELKEQIEYMITHKSQLETFKKNAMETAMKYHADEVMKILTDDIERL